VSKPTYEELEKQLAESVAHCAYQLKTIQALDDESNAWGVVLSDNLYDYLSISIRDNPKHSLLFHDADVIEAHKAFIKSNLPTYRAPLASWMKKELVTDDTVLEIRLSEFDDYANQLRAKAKEGVK
jgi:hypothetical protein